MGHSLQFIPSLLGDPTFKIGATYLLLGEIIPGLFNAPAAGAAAGDQSGLTGLLTELRSNLPALLGATPPPAANTATLITVPSVMGYPLQAAVEELRSVGLSSSFIRGNEAPTERQTNQVYYQEPEQGTQVAAGSSVQVMFYSRPQRETVKVPNLKGLTQQEAEAKLSELKFAAKPTAGKQRPPRTAKRREVYSQSPEADTEAYVGDTVSFEYYAGIPVGRYVGLTKDEAIEAIQKDELTPVVEEGDAMSANPAERHKVYMQSPQPDEYVWFDDPVEAWYYKFSEGFQEGDGKFVERAFATAKVSDGSEAVFQGAMSGERTAIMFQSGENRGEQTTKSLGWSIKRYTDGGPPRAVIAKASKDGFFLAQGSTALTIKHRLISGDHLMGTLVTAKATSHLNLEIYRGRFLITVVHMEPQAGLDLLTESKRIIEKSKQLIDRRFPEE